jgi:hypothetical protein
MIKFINLNENMRDVQGTIAHYSLVPEKELFLLSKINNF